MTLDPFSPLAGALNGVWQGALVACAVALSFRLLPRASAATRCAVCAVAIASIAGLTVLGGIGPRAEGRDLRAVAGGGDPGWTGALAAEGAGRPGDPGRPATGPADLRDGDARVLVLEASDGLARGLLLVWVLWASLQVGAVGFKAWRVRTWKRGSEPLPASVDAALRELAAGLRVRRQVAFRCSDAVESPVSLGWRRPAVLFPRRTLDALSKRQIELVGAHELAHVARRDDWGLLAQRLVEAVLFFNPALRWVGRRLEREREIACDDWVIARMREHPATYAAALVRLGELARDRRSGAALATGAASELRARTEALLDDGRRFAARASRGAITAVVLAVVVVILVPACRPTIGLSDRDEPPATRGDEVAAAETIADRERARWIEGLRADDPGVRARSAFRLSGLRGRALPAVPDLIALLTDHRPVPRTRGTTSPVWGRPGEDRDRTSPAEEAVKSMLYIGRPAQPALEEALARLPDASPFTHWAVELLRTFD